MIKKYLSAKYLVPLLLLTTVAIAQFATMPKFYYPGDNFAIRTEAANLAYTGQLGLDYSQRNLIESFLTEKGQYFFENDESQRFYSRYGFGNTIFYAPPYLINKWLNRQSNPVSSDPALLFILNGYSILATVMAGLFFYLSAALFSPKYSIRIFYVVAVLYGSFFSHYFKHPVHENFQIALTIAFFYFALRFFVNAEKKGEQWINILIASCINGILFTMKGSFLFFYVALGLALLLHFWIKFKKDVWRTIKEPVLKYLLYLVVPAVIALCVVLISNAVRFNSPFESGYGQWVRNDKVHYFSLGLLSKTLPGFLWAKGNANIVLHFPIILLSIPGLYLLYKQKMTGVIALILISFITYFGMISVYASWAGEWCYGPRHLVFILAGASTAAVYVLDRIPTKAKGFPIAAFSLLAIFLFLSAKSNFQVNRLQCFAYHQASGMFSQLKNEKINAYFKAPLTRSTIFQDIWLHSNEQQEFPPLEIVRTYPNSQQAYAQLDQAVRHFGQPNYFHSKQNETSREKTRR